VAKTVAAIVGMDADVLGIVEIENDGYGPDSAIAGPGGPAQRRDRAGTYAFVDVDAGTGQVNALGTDAIKVGLIYKPAGVTPGRHHGGAEHGAFVNGGDDRAAQPPGAGAGLRAERDRRALRRRVNHLKSKGSACDRPTPATARATATRCAPTRPPARATGSPPTPPAPAIPTS
jgi:uncharacterized protein